MRASHHDVDRLTTLIAYASANAEAYREAASDAEGFRVAAPLVHRAQEREAVAAHLRGCLPDGVPGSDRVPAAAGPGVPDVAALRDTAPADAGLLEAAGRDEAELRAAFESALGDDGLSARARMAVLKAYVAVRTGGDQVHDLYRSLRNGV